MCIRDRCGIFRHACIRQAFEARQMKFVAPRRLRLVLCHALYTGILALINLQAPDVAPGTPGAIIAGPFWYSMCMVSWSLTCAVILSLLPRLAKWTGRAMLRCPRSTAKPRISS